MFRLEPAVSGFDGPFTPRRRSREGIVGHQRYRASTCLSARFTLPTPRSSGFGLCSSDSPRLNTVTLAVRLRSYRFPYASPDSRVRLVRQAHSLVRFSKRTTEHRLPTRLTTGLHLVHFVWDLVCPVVRSPTEFTPYCTSLFGVLFSIRSRYYFAIGLEECLVFAVNARDIHEGYPTPATLELTHGVLVDGTGLSPCVVPCSKGFLVDGRPLQVSPNTTLPTRRLPRRLRFGLCRVHSPLLTTSRCFLFLSILRCFNSRRSLLRKAIAKRIPIRRSQVLSLRAGPLGLSQLGTSFFSSRAERSTSWHSSHVLSDLVRVVTSVTTGIVTRERVQWTPGLHVHTVSFANPVDAGGIHPSQPRLRGVVHRFCLRIRSFRRHPLKHMDSHSPRVPSTHPHSSDPLEVVYCISRCVHRRSDAHHDRSLTRGVEVSRSDRRWMPGRERFWSSPLDWGPCQRTRVRRTWEN